MPPEHPGAAGFPQDGRTLVGWSAARILEELGAPESRHAGNSWSVPEGWRNRTYSRQADGQIQEMQWFGPKGPRVLQPGDPYETWRYENVRSCVWLLYVAGKPAEEAVVDLDVYPVGAIF